MQWDGEEGWSAGDALDVVHKMHGKATKRRAQVPLGGEGEAEGEGAWAFPTGPSIQPPGAKAPPMEKKMKRKAQALVRREMAKDRNAEGEGPL